jgi:hypothetical protein
VSLIETGQGRACGPWGAQRSCLRVGAWCDVPQVPDLRRCVRARVQQTALCPARRKTRWTAVTGAQRLKGPATGSGPACWRHAGLRGDIEEAGYGARRLSCHRPLRRSCLGPGGGLGVTARVDPNGRGCIAAFACHGPEGILPLNGLGGVRTGRGQARICAARRGTRRRAAKNKAARGVRIVRIPLAPVRRARPARLSIWDGREWSCAVSGGSPQERKSGPRRGPQRLTGSGGLRRHSR